MDPREDIALAFEEPEVRRTSVAPPQLRPLAELPAPPKRRRPARRPDIAPAEPVAPDAEPGEEELPGRRRSRLQYLELYVTGRAYELLTAQRAEGKTLGQAAIDALRHSRRWLLDTYAPPPPGDEQDDFFPPPRRSHRRFHVAGGRHISAGVSPEEAAAVSRLAEQVDLTLSELVSVAVEHHSGEPTES